MDKDEKENVLFTVGADTLHDIARHCGLAVAQAVKPFLVKLVEAVVDHDERISRLERKIQEHEHRIDYIDPRDED